MSPDNSVLRPSDRELVRATSARLRKTAGIPVVFAGLRDRDVIQVTESVGHQTAALRTITVTPERGLGGLTWLNKRAKMVRDYGSASEITHDFDDQILGEGITDLAAAPIVVDGAVRGLLYGGWRGGGGLLGEHAMDALSLEAGRIGTELRIRDEVDRRVAAIAAREQAQRPIPDWIHELRDIATGAEDEQTRRRIGRLVDQITSVDRSGVEPTIALTPRQLQVLSLVAMGFGNRVVADRLGLTVDTVKTYLRAAMVRLGARTRHEAVVKARAAGHVLELI
ncbi:MULTISPECIES: helix-turn-helix transcriptional regulator [Actinomycetes]|uniref:Helix-turn-helix transcriptional regulator n=1 Tax=Williamsia marianensis TaxID=85044 RepID=A0ABU4EUZ4_WILMA|nr:MULTISPECIES: helix-turn-helix transcriptional regulator [Actinomycetes]MCK0516948.1 helix-turn-helix transcriptional regulator [Williamsia sp. DF01-3]MDV7135070.1 helix-turn-helix transcriptional regulator [Williamsia muralis]PVY29889.1 regulatory LuxR family protein [Williamsia marianensis]